LVYNSAIYLFVFFPLAFGLSRLIPGGRAKSWLLAVLSLLFYAFGGLAALPVLLLSVAANYVLGRLLAAKKNRGVLTIGIVLNLGILSLYKYLGFFLSVVAPNAANPIGVLPAGISFFTFQAVAYLADIYCRDEEPARGIDEMILYLAFFPRVLSGPLVRYSDAAAQLRELSFAPMATAEGLRRFVIGFAKKVFIADILGGVTAGVFGAEVLDARLAWLGAVSYMLQLYFDFSGYSDMAIGMGRIFGFRFPENFNYPYIARSITEFWRRWHITLSGWFRDYLYIPLGGNRKGNKRTMVNKLIVFMATGLWHGAGWTFILWGLWHGLFMMLESAAKPVFNKLESSRGGRILCHVYTLTVVMLGFILFRAATLAEAGAVMGSLFNFRFTAEGALALRKILGGQEKLALLLGVVFAMPLRPWLNDKLPRDAAGLAIRNVLTLLLFLLCLMGMAGSGFTPFIYFQF